MRIISDGSCVNCNKEDFPEENPCRECASHWGLADPLCPMCKTSIEKEKGELAGSTCMKCKKLHHEECLPWVAVQEVGETNWRLWNAQLDKEEIEEGPTSISCLFCPACCPRDENGECTDNDRASILQYAADFYPIYSYSYSRTTTPTPRYLLSSSTPT